MKQIRANSDLLLGFENAMELHGKSIDGKYDVVMTLDEARFKCIANLFMVTNHLGHALWHYNNGMPVPCESCNKQTKF